MTRNNALPRASAWMVLGSFACGVVLHIDRTPLWCAGVAIAALCWQVMHTRGQLRLPGTVVRISITLALIAATVASFRTFNGLAAGSALLLVMGAAKLLEVRQLRDAQVVALVSLVLLLAACLDRQSLLRLPLYLITGWMALGALATLSGAREATTIRTAFGTSGKALLYAAPLAALCFVLVPRLPGALWSLPSNEKAQTGLSDEMSPGSISELSASDEAAFRVRFAARPPPVTSRYWRGPVLHDFDGYTWRRNRGQLAAKQPVEILGPAVRYQVMLEPHNRSYLFALDTVLAVENRRHILTFDGQALATQPVTAAITYTAVSHLHVRAPGRLSVLGRRLDTQLPANRNPRSLTLAQTLRSRSASDRDYTNAVLHYFRATGFEYSLTPPLLDYNSVDDLIFNTKLGFCGHFASAYVTLMRAAGVPARVVTGYMGGEWNSIGGYYTVRQSDAHAWAEVWLDGEGWVRIDPTAVVAPERMQAGLRDILPDSGSVTSRLLRNPAWARELLQAWDASNSWWRERVVNFNLGTQLALMEQFGLEDIDYRGLALLLFGGAVLWGLLLAYGLSRHNLRPKPDALGALWLHFIALLRKRGLPVAISDGPRAITDRAALRLPSAAAQINTFSENYLRLRFGPGEQCRKADLRNQRALLRQIARATTTGHRSRTAPTERE